MDKATYDLVVIGSGPAGQKGAIAAAKLGKKVAVVDRKGMLGGVSLHTGTIPSKTMREAVMYMTGFRQRAFYGSGYSLKERVSKEDLSARVRTVLERELEVVRHQFRRNEVTVIQGSACFLDPHTIVAPTDAGDALLSAEKILIACGTRPARDPMIPFDGQTVIDAGELESLAEIPKDLIVVGAGVIGIEYASMCAALVYAVGRQSNADLLNLEAAGVPIDKRGRIGVNEHFQTAIPHIYAAGDVIGFPALAATSMEQGRLAACHMFGAHSTNSASPLPYGVYTIPEISMIGKTERQLTAEKIPYEVGIARYEELARGQILGDQTGRLKLLFDPRDLTLLGIHIIGEGATELVHIGQAIMNTGATIEYFRDTVCNYPTLAEAYKVAALNGLNKLRN